MDDGIRDKDYIIVEAGTITMDAADDGLKADNENEGEGNIYVTDGTVTVSAGDDGFHAEGDITITGGQITVVDSYEGIEGANVTIAGGIIDVTASDEAINVASNTAGDGMASNSNLLSISGGVVVLNSGGDGLDSNGDILMTGGTVIVYGPTNNGNGALDANGSLTVNGGTLVAAGSSGMAEAPETSSEQNWISVTFASEIPVGETIQIVDSDNEIVASFETIKPITSLIVASADTEYTVWIGGTVEELIAGTYSTSGNINDATQTVTVTSGQHEGGMGGPGGGFSGGNNEQFGATQGGRGDRPGA